MGNDLTVQQGYEQLNIAQAELSKTKSSIEAERKKISDYEKEVNAVVIPRRSLQFQQQNIPFLMSGKSEQTFTTIKKEKQNALIKSQKAKDELFNFEQTELKQAEQKLIDYKGELERVDKLNQAFVTAEKASKVEANGGNMAWVIDFLKNSPKEVKEYFVSLKEAEEYAANLKRDALYVEGIGGFSIDRTFQDEFADKWASRGFTVETPVATFKPLEKINIDNKDTYVFEGQGFSVAPNKIGQFSINYVSKKYPSNYKEPFSGNEIYIAKTLNTQDRAKHLFKAIPKRIDEKLNKYFTKPLEKLGATETNIKSWTAMSLKPTPLMNRLSMSNNTYNPKLYTKVGQVYGEASTYVVKNPREIITTAGVSYLTGGVFGAASKILPKTTLITGLGLSGVAGYQGIKNFNGADSKSLGKLAVDIPVSFYGFNKGVKGVNYISNKLKSWWDKEIILQKVKGEDINRYFGDIKNIRKGDKVLNIAQYGLATVRPSTYAYTTTRGSMLLSKLNNLFIKDAKPINDKTATDLELLYKYGEVGKKELSKPSVSISTSEPFIIGDKGQILGNIKNLGRVKVTTKTTKADVLPIRKTTNIDDITIKEQWFDIVSKGKGKVSISEIEGEMSTGLTEIPKIDTTKLSKVQKSIFNEITKDNGALKDLKIKFTDNNIKYAQGNVELTTYIKNIKKSGNTINLNIKKAGSRKIRGQFGAIIESKALRTTGNDIGLIESEILSERMGIADVTKPLVNKRSVDLKPRKINRVLGMTKRQEYNLPYSGETESFSLGRGKSKTSLTSLYAQQKQKSSPQAVLGLLKANAKALGRPKINLNNPITKQSSGQEQSIFYGKGMYEKTDASISQIPQQKLNQNFMSYSKSKADLKTFINVSNKNIVRTNTSNVNKEITRELLRTTPKEMVKSLERTLPKEINKTNLKFNQKNQFKQIQKQMVKNPPRVPTRNIRLPLFKIIVPKKRPSRVPNINIGFGALSNKSKSQFKLKERYTPSLTPLVFNIRGKVPKKINGGYAPTWRPIPI